MGRYLIKTRMRVFEAENSVQLARFAQMGLIARDALIKNVHGGRWVRAEDHPDIGRLFWQRDEERTVVASLFDSNEATRAVGTPRPESQVFWVRTDVSTVEVRGVQVLRRLNELGVVRSSHEVSLSQDGPFEPISMHPQLAEHFSDSSALPTISEEDEEEGEGTISAVVKPLRRPTKGSIEANAGTQEVSVVVALSEDEIEYFQDTPPEEQREVSNVILLSASDLEVIEEEELQELEIFADEPPASDEVIALSPDDIEDFEEESAADPDPLPLQDASWHTFRGAMSTLSKRLARIPAQVETTWDLFRSMMEKRAEDGRVGPSESSWRRFQTHLGARQKSNTPITGDTTWDRFRQLMTRPGRTSNTTWDRFVISVQKRRSGKGGDRRGSSYRKFGSAIAGEAPIKSGVTEIPSEQGPNIHVDGLEE